MEQIEYEFNKYFEHEYTWTAIELALSSSTGILLSFEFKNIALKRGKDLSVGEQIIAAFGLTFLAAVIYKFIIGFIKKHHKHFVIYDD